MKSFSIEEFRKLPIPSESEIVASWKTVNPVVSIVCTTFNHGKYIEDAIRGFLRQKTSFPFEIIIHDDASVDSTKSIISRFADTYPRVVKAIFPERNLYSQGVRMLLHASGYAAGDFIAFCEGDDYWISERKLQSQFEAFAENHGCEICFHSAIKTTNEIPHELIYCRRAQVNRVFDVNPIIRCGGSFMPTASIMIRRSFFNRVYQDQTSFYTRNLDAYFFQIFCSLAGGALYIDSPMSVYRSFTENSWTLKIQKDQNFYLNWMFVHLARLHEADTMTAYLYHEDFSAAIQRSCLSILNNINIDRNIRRDFYIEHKNETKLMGALLWYGVFQFPCLHRLFLKLRYFVNNHIRQGLI